MRWRRGPPRPRQRSRQGLAEIQARTLKEGKVFEHRSAAILFFSVIGVVVLAHVAVLIVMMASGMR